MSTHYYHITFFTVPGRAIHIIIYFIVPYQNFTTKQPPQKRDVSFVFPVTVSYINFSLHDTLWAHLISLHTLSFQPASLCYLHHIYYTPLVFILSHALILICEYNNRYTISQVGKDSLSAVYIRHTHIFENMALFSCFS